MSTLCSDSLRDNKANLCLKPIMYTLLICGPTFFSTLKIDQESIKNWTIKQNQYCHRNRWNLINPPPSVFSFVLLIYLCVMYTDTWKKTKELFPTHWTVYTLSDLHQQPFDDRTLPYSGVSADASFSAILHSVIPDQTDPLSVLP